MDSGSSSPSGSHEARAAPERESVAEEHVRVLRAGHGANCSSIGSVVDTLFATATLGAAVFAAVLAALGREDVKVVGSTDEPSSTGPTREEDR